VRRLSKYILILESSRFTTWLLKLLGATLTESIRLESNQSQANTFSVYKASMLTDIFFEDISAEVSDSVTFDPKESSEIHREILLQQEIRESKAAPIWVRKTSVERPSAVDRGTVTVSLESIDHWPNAAVDYRKVKPKNVPNSKGLPALPTERQERGEGFLEFKAGPEKVTSRSVSKEKDEAKQVLRPKEEHEQRANVLPVMEDSPEWTYGFDETYNRKVLAVTVKLIKKMDNQDAADFVGTLDPVLADQILKDKDLPAVVKGIVIGKQLGARKVSLNSYIESQKSVKENFFGLRTTGVKNGN